LDLKRGAERIEPRKFTEKRLKLRYSPNDESERTIAQPPMKLSKHGWFEDVDDEPRNAPSVAALAGTNVGGQQKVRDDHKEKRHTKGSSRMVGRLSEPLIIGAATKQSSCNRERSSCSTGISWDDDVVVGGDENGEDYCVDGSAEPGETQIKVESGNEAHAFPPTQGSKPAVDHCCRGMPAEASKDSDCEKDSGTGTSAKRVSRPDSEHLPGDHAAAATISALQACQNRVATAMQALKEEKDTLKEYFRLKMNLSDTSAHYSKTLTQLDTQIEFTAESVKDMTEELKELKKEEAALLASMKQASRECHV
jgi:hypothetical protein